MYRSKTTLIYFIAKGLVNLQVINKDAVVRTYDENVCGLPWNKYKEISSLLKTELSLITLNEK